MNLDNKKLHLLIPVIIAVILNYIINVKKWNNNKKTNTLLPPGPIVGIIWITVLLSLGNAHYLLYKKNNITLGSLYLIGVMFYCISYPFITKLDRNKGLTMNVIAFILSAILMVVVYRESTEAFVYTLPLFVWISFVNYSDALTCSKSFEKI